MAIPVSQLDGLLCAFGSNIANFALATPDGRVRTYDTVSGRLRSTLSTGLTAAKGAVAAANGHLVEGQQCLTWVDSEELSAQARSGVPAGPSPSWLAIGTSGGSVKAYDSATGELKWQAAHTNEGGVACLAYTPSQAGLLFSSGPDGQAVSLDPTTGASRGTFKGSKHGATAAALSTDGNLLLLGGSTLSLWDLGSQQRLTRLTGHPLPVRAAAFSPDARCVVSAAVGERLVAVWVVGAGGGGRKKKSGGGAAASLAVGHPVVQLATAAAAEGAPEGSFYAAATTEAGGVVVWLITPNADGVSVEAHQVARLAVHAQHAQHEAIFAAALEASPAGATLVAAVGSAAKPRFERVSLGSKPISSSKVTFLQPPPGSAEALIRPGGAAAAAAGDEDDQGATAAAAAGGRRGAQAAAEVLGPDNAGELVQQRVGKKGKKRAEPEPYDAAGGPAQQAADGDDEAAEGGMADAGVEDGIDEEEQELQQQQQQQGQLTMGQRVQELEKQQQQQQQQQQGLEQQQQQQQQQGLEDPSAAGGAQAAAALPAGPLKADSLAVLLSQALRASDAALLERCLAVGRRSVIVNSVRRLVPMDAAALLREAVQRLQSRPRRGAQLAAWVQALLLHHTAYLMAAPAAAPLLSSLYALIEARLAQQRALLSLAGRLELLLAQRGPAGGAGGAATAGMAQVVYQESDSEAEVELVDAAGGASDSEGDYYTDDEGEEDDGDVDDGDDDGSSDDGDGSSDDDDDDAPGSGSGGDSDADMADGDDSGDDE